MKKALHILLIALTCCEGCKKDDPKPLTELEKLPPATQSGKNTMGCLINGKAFVPATSDFSIVYQKGIFQLGSSTYSPLKSVGLTIDETNYGLLSTGSYPLNKYPDSSAGAYIQIGNNSYCTYIETSTFAGDVTLTNLDRTKYIVSGKFEFSTVTNGCDTLKITNGRFDIKYIP